MTRSSSDLPGREKQIELLKSLLFRSDSSSIFLYGMPSTGKTSVIKSLIKDLRQPYAYVDAVSTLNTRMFCERVLNQLYKHEPTPENGYSCVCRCENTFEFVNALKTSRFQKMFIFIENIDSLMDLGDDILTVLMTLSELCDKRVTSVFTSNNSWDHFYLETSPEQPILMHFPAYTKQETIRILAKRVPATEPDPSCFIGFVQLIYDVFHKACTDLKELEYLVDLIFPKYLEPVFDNQAERSDIGKLTKHISFYLKDTLSNLYLRHVSFSEWQEAPSTAELLANSGELKKEKKLELPYFTKLLLISAFLASYNPPRYDTRFFAKAEEHKKKKGGGAKKHRESTVSSMRQQLLGPKAFPVERMLAIFYSIVEDPVLSGVEIQTQIASLIKLKLLTRLSTPEKLDGIKCKCNVSFDFIKQLGQSIRFDVCQYLHDFW